MKKAIFTAWCLVLMTGMAWSQYGSKSGLGNSKYTFDPPTGLSGNGYTESTVIFSDNFDVSDTNALKGRGWILYQYSQPVGITFWFQGNTGTFPQYEGTGYVGANYNNTAGVGVINSWMVSPLIDMAVGDTITYWERSPDGSTYPDSLYLKISPTGDPAASSFTIPVGGGQVSTTGWAQRRFVSTVSGSVRIALQYHVTNAGPSGSNSDYIGIDDLKILRGGTPPGAFHLLEPANGIRMNVHPTYPGGLTAVWSTAQDTGTVTYKVVLDSSMSFGLTKVELTSNNGGLDTTYELDYSEMDTYLSWLGVPRGDSITIYWKVVASNGTLTTPSAEVWTLNVVRDNFEPSAFDLIAPPNGFRAVVSAASSDSAVCIWSASVDPEGEAMTYTWMVDTSIAFGATTWSKYAGEDTTLKIPIVDIDNYIATLGVLPGDSVTLYWAVMASDGFNNIASTSIYEVNAIRENLVNNPPTPVHLLIPTNGSRIVVYPNMPDSMNITWTASTDPDADPVTYTFVIDRLPTFNSGDEFASLSNNSGADTVWTAYLEGLEEYVENLGVAFGDSIVLYWKIVASDGLFNINSSETFTMNVIRTLPPATVIFYDDFESGTTNWTLQGTWGLTTLQSVSPTHSLTESPSGNYANNLNISATLTNGLDLSSALDATLSFWGRYVIETGFDTMYVEVSTNGTTWTTIGGFSGENPPSWQKYSFSLGGFVGYNNVKIRFRFFSDVGYTVDGMYIDNVEISASNYDASAPLITHVGPEFYQGTIGAKQVAVSIVDVSGIEYAELKYTVDNASIYTISPDSNNGSNYYFTIPAYPAGAWIDYWIEAADNSPDHNFGASPVYKYISGNYIAYDDPTVDFVTNFGTGTGAAVKFNTPTNYKARLVTALIRNYTDVNRPNDSMIVHIWSDNGLGYPDVDLIPPFKVKPEATLTNTSPMTRIDLRPYAANLSDLTVFHVGFTVPDGAVDTVWITIKQPGSALRSNYFDGSAWNQYTNTDFHFRVVMDSFLTTVGISDVAELPKNFQLYQNFPNPFNPTTTIKYDLTEPTKVTLKIYNTMGQEVRTLVNKNETAGYKSVVWDGRDNAGNVVSSGLYIYRLQAGKFVKSHKMLFVK